MLRAFQQFIDDNELCSYKEKILVAVSGGIDSVVMLDLFHRAEFHFAIAHCNFKLRGAESDGDEVFVQELAKKYKVTIYSKVCNAASFAEKHKCTIQEAARELRYAWFKKLCKDEKFDKVAVAQQADDQIETFFINLLRGSGVSGLKGMPVKREMVIRPLLFVERSAIEKYAAKRKLVFREDSSNLSDKYLRNQIRHHVLPQFAVIDQNYRQQIEKSLEFLQDDYQLLKQLLEEKMEILVKPEKDTSKISIDKILAEKNWQLLLYYLLKEFGFNRDVTDSICESIQKRFTGKLFYADDHRLLLDRDFLIIEKNSNKTVDEVYYINSRGENLNEPFVLKSKVIENHPELKIEKDPAFAYFDLDKLSFPLVIRKWKKGDRFIPFGMKGSKLVSDYLVDEKIDRFEKEKVYVMESGGKIVWLIGYRVCNDFRITAKSNMILMYHLIRK